MISFIFAWVSAIVANLLIGWDIHYQLITNDPKGFLQTMLVGFFAIPLAIISAILFNVSGWSNWYFLLFVLPLYNFSKVSYMFFPWR